MHRLSRLEDYEQHLKREAILHGIVHHRHLLKMDLYIFQLCFVHITGEALDKKTPLLRSCDALSKAACRLLPLLGEKGITKVTASVGAEQEYFLVDDKYYQERMDLKLTGRTLFGAMAPKGQELEDHYFGSLKRKVSAFMKDLDHELWNMEFLQNKT